MLDLYLRELERELARKLSADQVEALLSEAIDHLELSIQARLELGSTRLEAEREAVATFGRRETFVARRPDPERARILSLRLLTLVGATLAIMGSTVLFLLTDWVWIAVTPLVVVGLLAASAFALGFRSRRPTPIPFALGGIGASLGFMVMMGATTLNLSRYGASTQVLRWGARDAVAASLARSVPPGRTWRVRDVQGRVSTMMEGSSLTPYDDSDLAAIPRAEADPVGNALSQVGMGFSCGMTLASVAGAFDLLGAGFGWLWSRRRTRRPTVA